MRLAAYLDEQKMTDEEFGDKIGVSRQAVHRYKTFERFPATPVLTRIVEVTAGAVTPNDFLQTAVPQEGA